MIKMAPSDFWNGTMALIKDNMTLTKGSMERRQAKNG